MTTLKRPVAGQPFSNSDGAGHPSTTIMDEAFDLVEANEAALTARTHSSVISASSFSDLAPVTLHSADTLSGGSPSGTWTAVLGQSGAVATLDTTNKTTGTGSISAQLAYGSTGQSMLYCNLTDAVTIGDHAGVAMDIRYSGQSGPDLVHQNFQMVIADGAALTGTTATLTLNDSNLGVSGAFNNITIPKGSVTSVKSFGIRRISGSGGGSGSRFITWNIDNPTMGADTALDLALNSQSTLAVMVPPTYTTAQTQELYELGTTKALLDLRPTHVNLARHRGVKSIRDWNIDETGTTDVTADFQAILDSLSPGDILTSPPSAIYRIDGRVDFDMDGITVDMQGARVFATQYLGEAMFGVTGHYNTFLNWRVFSHGGLIKTHLGSALSAASGSIPQGTAPGAVDKAPVPPNFVAGSVSGSTYVLDAQYEGCRIPLYDGTDQASGSNGLCRQYNRDEYGMVQFDIVLYDTNHVSGDVTIAVTNQDGDEMDFKQTYTLTGTVSSPQTITVRTRLLDPMARQRVTVMKTTATANTISVVSMKGYYQWHYATSGAADGGDPSLNACFIISGTGLTFENCWFEGNGGDGIQIRGNAAHGLRVRKYFARGQGRENMEFSQGQDIDIEDFVFAGCAREPVDIEPETDGSKLSHVRFRNGVMGSGWNYGFVSSGSNPNLDATRMDHCSMQDIWFRYDSNPGFRMDFTNGGVLKDLVFTWEGSASPGPGTVDIRGDGCVIDGLDVAGTFTCTGTNNTIQNVWVRRAQQEGAFIISGAGNTVGHIRIGDVAVPVTIDTSLAFNPVILATGTVIDGPIICPLWSTEFGNTYKSPVLTGQTWYPRGQDMYQSGTRRLRGISATTTPANNLRGIGVPVTLGATSAVVTFPARTDVMNPPSFTLTAQGPETDVVTCDTGVGIHTGTWTCTFNGSTTSAIAMDANAATVQTAVRALPTVGTNVTITGTPLVTSPNNGGSLTFTWANALGPTPKGLLSFTSAIKDKNSHTRPIDFQTTVEAGNMTSGTYYYRVAGRTPEGMPLGGLTEKSVVLGAQNAVKVSTGAPSYNTTTDLRVAGLTIWRGTTAGGPYTQRYDLIGQQDLVFPSSIIDMGTTDSGGNFTAVTGSWTAAEVSSNQSGWEPDSNFAVWVTPNWSTTVAVTKTDTSLFQPHGSGFTVTFGTAAPAGATFDWGLIR